MDDLLKELKDDLKKKILEEVIEELKTELLSDSKNEITEKLIYASIYKPIFARRVDAEDVLDKMYELFDVYGTVTLADLKDLSGIGTIYTDNIYGWTNLEGFDVKRVREGYAIICPAAERINK